MKKFISIILAVTMLFSMMSLVSYAADGSLTFAVASDIHYAYDTIAEKSDSTSESEDDVDSAFIPEDEAYSHIGVSGQLFLESEAILDKFISDVISDSKITTVLLSGDLVNEDTESETNATAAKLREIEQAGKSVYVVPGNHDVLNTTKARFKEIYNAYGYAEAIAQDSNSISYVADLDDNYRLLAIDTTGEGESGNALSATTVEWIKTQCEQARKDEKHLVAMMHHNILEHFAYDVMHEGALIDESYGLAELFAEYDVKYTFSGHTHSHDIMQYTGANGNVIYEAVTGALNAYPVSYRVVTFSDTAAELSTRSITSVDTSAFSSLGISDEAIAHAKADFKGYAQTCYRVGIKSLFSGMLCASTLKNYLDVDYESNQEVARILDKVGEKLAEIVAMPLYERDKTAEDEFSVQEITESYGGILPASHYKDLLDVMVILYDSHASGSYGLTMNSDEYFVVVHGFAAVLNYCLYSISEQEYGVLIRFIAEKLSPTLGQFPSELYAYMAGGKQGFEQNIIFMTYLISPFLKSTVSDSVPADRDVTLGAYKSFASDATATPGAPDEEDNSFRAQMASFFDRIIEFFRMVFKILTFQDIF